MNIEIVYDETTYEYVVPNRAGGEYYTDNIEDAIDTALREYGSCVVGDIVIKMERYKLGVRAT